MWLIDVNLPTALAKTLKQLGIPAKTTESQGWRALENGELIAAAAAAGFTTILTRDREFGLSAGRALKQFSEISVVIITLPQHKEKLYITRFLEAWRKGPIRASPGKVRYWPQR